MPYARSTLIQEQTQALQDLQASGIPGIDGMLRVGVLPVLTFVIAGFSYEHYGYQDWISKQAVPWTATDEYLYGWAALKGIYQKPATPATGFVSFSGNLSGDIPAGTPINRSDGLAFISTADALIPAGLSVNVAVQAIAPGSAGHTLAGTLFYLATPLLNIGSTGTAVADFVGYSDPESVDAFRFRAMKAWATTPQGGALTDYVEWALQVPGVAAAWAVPLENGAGTVSIYFMMNDYSGPDAGFPQGTNGVAALETRDIPATGDQLTVANYIYPLRPVTALVYAKAPTPQPINYTITTLSPLTAPIETAITAALIAMHQLQATLGGTLYQSDWDGAIASVAGVVRFTVTAPVAPVVAAVGAILTVGTVSFA